MHYCSTRGGVQGRSFRDVLFSGYAPDGGMFMPETIPTLSAQILISWRHLSYQQLMCEICSLFIPEHEIPQQHLQELISEALSKFSIPETVRIVSLRDSLSILELFHGETLAFKDLAMSCTAQFLKYFLLKEKKRATILVGTSGDTGSSAIRSVLGLRQVDIVVLFPRARISTVQERQMTTSMADHVHVFAAEGTSDDIDVPLRKLFADSDLVKRHGLMSLNSVNWARILLQLPHFLFAYLQLSGLEPDHTLPALELLVPTGGAGNITAGCVLKMMGVPLRLVATVNTNDIVHRTLQSGDFSMASHVLHTLAPAIDIQDPYNLERIFWLLSAGDAPMVQSLMEEFQKTHRTSLPVTLHQQVSAVLSSGCVCDEEILHTMQRCYQENAYLLCPHTAVSVCYHYTHPITAGLNRCCIATASPAKFQEAVLRAGLTLDLPEALQALETMETRFRVLEQSEDWECALRQQVELISSVRQRGEMFYTTHLKQPMTNAVV